MTAYVGGTLVQRAGGWGRGGIYYFVQLFLYEVFDVLRVKPLIAAVSPVGRKGVA